MIDLFKIIGYSVIRLSQEIKYYWYIKNHEKGLKIYRDYKP